MDRDREWWDGNRRELDVVIRRIDEIDDTRKHNSADEITDHFDIDLDDD